MPRPLVLACLLLGLIPAAAHAADTEPRKRFTTADQAKARAVVLKRTDLVAGWKSVASAPETDAKCPGFDPDSSDLTLSGESESNFAHAQGFPRISSYVEIFATRADALASWARTVKPAIARCLAFFLRLGVEQEGGKVTIVSQGRIAFPKVAPRTAAFRVVTRLTLAPPGQAPVTVPLTMHVLAVGHGRGDAALVTSGFGTGVQMADLRFLAKTLASRLAAAKL